MIFIPRLAATGMLNCFMRSVFLSPVWRRMGILNCFMQSVFLSPAGGGGAQRRGWTYYFVILRASVAKHAGSFSVKQITQIAIEKMNSSQVISVFEVIGNSVHTRDAANRLLRESATAESRSTAIFWISTVQTSLAGHLRTSYISESNYFPPNLTLVLRCKM